MEIQINLFESASSAGSEKAKKMGLISAGFGRYRSKDGGPITHKVVGGKLVKSQDSKGKSKPKDADLKKLMSLRKKNYSDSDIEFPAKDALRLKKDLIAYCKAHPDPQWKEDGYDPIPELQAADEDDVYELMASAEEFGLLDDPDHYMWKYVDRQSPDIKKFKKQAGL